MCKSLAEGGQRCYNHANADYNKARTQFDKEVQQLDKAKENFQILKDQKNILDIAYEMGSLTDDQYNHDLDVLVVQRDQLISEINELNHKATQSKLKVDKTLSEVRTTPKGLKLLKEQMDAEKNIVEKHRLKFAYDAGTRLRNVREAAFERFKERQVKAEHLEAKAAEKFATAEKMPDYDYQTRQIKERIHLDGELFSAKAYLERNNGREAFPALFDQEGNVVPAKITKTKYGHSWGILSDPKDPSSRFTSFVTIPASQDPKKRAAFYASKGLTVGKVWADAQAVVVKDENNVQKVSIQRNDGGYSPFAETLVTNQYKEK